MLILLLLVPEENETQNLNLTKEFHFSVYKDALYKAVHKYYKVLYWLNNAFFLFGFFFCCGLGFFGVLCLPYLQISNLFSEPKPEEKPYETLYRASF